MLSDGDSGQIVARRHDARRRHRQRVEPQAFGDVHREPVVDVQQVRDHARADRARLDLAQLEYERSRDVLALERSSGSRRTAALGCSDRRSSRGERDAWRRSTCSPIRDEAAARRLRGHSAREPRVRRVVDAAGRVEQRHVPVLLEVPERALRRIDRQLHEVRAAEPFHLRIEIREVAPLQQADRC